MICSLAIVNCASCNNALPTTCSSCDPGFSVSGDGLQCYACPLNCKTCLAGGVCSVCTDGYNWDGSSCVCGGSCTTCNGLTGGSCSACVNATYCTACSAPHYFESLTNSCPGCMSDCESCADSTTCISCKAPFIVDINKLCICNNTAGDYLSLDTSTCQSCSTVITHCLACTATPSTICTTCPDGRFFDSGAILCSLCQSPCVTCTASALNCLTCEPTYVMMSAGNC